MVNKYKIKKMMSATNKKNYFLSVQAGSNNRCGKGKFSIPPSAFIKTLRRIQRRIVKQAAELRSFSPYNIFYNRWLNGVPKGTGSYFRTNV